MINKGQHINSINTDFCDTMFAEYMSGLWGISVGYSHDSMWQTVYKKQVADWQLENDCANLLCIKSNAGCGTPACNACPPTPCSVIITYPTWGKSPYPQIFGPVCAPSERPIYAPAVPQTIVLSTPPVITVQFEVGLSGGPVSGTTSFTPLNAAGYAYLTNATLIDFALGAFLQLGVDYTFSTTAGTLSLVGRLFNPGEVYTLHYYYP